MCQVQVDERRTRKVWAGDGGAMGICSRTVGRECLFAGAENGGGNAAGTGRWVGFESESRVE